MPVFWVTANDGAANFKVQAADAVEALDKLGRSLRYEDFAGMAADLGYSHKSFRIATIEVESREYDAEGQRLKVERERDNIVTNAFKHLRRLGRG